MSVKSIPNRAIKSAPALSSVAKAAGAAVRSGRTTGATVTPINDEARGRHVAERLFAAVMAENSTIRGFFGEILLMPAEGTKEFRKTLAAKKNEHRALDKAMQTAMVRSALVRISESVTISKARDVGMTMQHAIDAWNAKGGKQVTAADVPQAWIVQFSRIFIAKAAEAAGKTPTNGGGRVRMTVTEKVKLYVLRNYTPKDLPALAALMASLAKRVKTAKDVTAELAKHEDAKPKGKDRRVAKRSAVSVKAAPVAA